jgi:CRISPR/Cas system CMR subunit Cmr4 (Cas7 group RAMP superfamily)
MKKKKSDEKQSSENNNVYSDSHLKESDKAILENITMRKEENQALKKLLDNLNSTLSKSKA